jgi:hypothetical protein
MKIPFEIITEADHSLTSWYLSFALIQIDVSITFVAAARDNQQNPLHELR